MLSKEDNELLTRTGPGTPMGNALRRYWVPMPRHRSLPPRLHPQSVYSWNLSPSRNSP